METTQTDLVDWRVMLGVVIRGLLWIVGGFLVKHGYEQAQVATWVQAAAEMLLALTTIAAATVWSWVHRQGLVHEARMTERWKPIRNGSPPAASLLVMGLLLGVIVAGSVAGCSPAPTQRYRQAGETYVTALDTLTVLRQQGQINDATAVQIEIARRVAAQALDDMATDLWRSGELDDVTAGRLGVNTALPKTPPAAGSFDASWRRFDGAMRQILAAEASLRH